MADKNDRTNETQQIKEIKLIAINENTSFISNNSTQ